ncbi:hypothetical protein RJI07_08280 [Mycoplasmatota bacterium WC30]
MENYNDTGFNYILNDYEELQIIEKKKTMKIMTIITVSFLVVSVIAFLLGTNLSNNGIIIAFYILSGITGLLIITLVILNFVFHSNKPLFNFLYKKAVEDINLNQNTNISIKAFLKDKEFIVEGGLFPLGNGRYLRYKLNFTSKGGYNTTIYDTYIYTQVNKSTIIHIDGLYFILGIRPDNTFQLRSKGRPRLKNRKMVKVNFDSDIKEYVEEGQTKDIPKKYYTLYKKLHTSKMPVFLSGIGGDVHVALHGYHKFRKIKKLTKSDFESLKEYIVSIVNIAENMYETIK